MFQMKVRFVVILSGLLLAAVANAGGMSKRQYGDLYDLKSMNSKLGGAAKKCLAAWGTKSPFKNVSATKFRVIESEGSLFGLGSDIKDTSKTSYPQLIVIESGANVMGKSNISLLNPKGWYCLDGNVTVMGKTTITLACKASMANTSDSSTVLGATRGSGASGTTVMGKTVIKRNCK